MFLNFCGNPDSISHTLYQPMGKIKNEQLSKVKMTSLCHMHTAFQHIQGFLEAFFQYKNAVFKCEKKESIIRVRVG